MMNVPLLDLKRQYHNLKGEIDSAIEKVCESTAYILGPQVTQIEESIAQFCDTKHGIGVANGTDAIELILRALEIGEGDEVITTPFTFFSTAEVVSKVGAKPVFVDVDPTTYLIDVTQIEKAITDKTKAIIPVHIFGQACDMDPMMEIAKKHDLYVIEDCAQAIGAEYKGKKVGSIGHAGTLSFFPSKNLGCFGDGGMVVTNDDDINKKIRILRAHGSYPKYYYQAIGYNSRLDELQAAILNVKFPHLANWNEFRRKHAYRYNELLGKVVGTPGEASYEQYHVYHQYTIATDRREELQNFLKEAGIGNFVYYPLPLHLQEVYADLGYAEGDLPHSEKACQTVLSLPISPEMTIEEQDYVIGKVLEFFNN